MKLRNSPFAELVATYIAVFVGDGLAVEVGVMVGHCYEKCKSRENVQESQITGNQEVY
jgi:hypothetical protein